MPICARKFQLASSNFAAYHITFMRSKRGSFNDDRPIKRVRTSSRGYQESKKPVCGTQQCARISLSRSHTHLRVKQEARVRPNHAPLCSYHSDSNNDDARI